MSRTRRNAHKQTGREPKLRPGTFTPILNDVLTDPDLSPVAFRVRPAPAGPGREQPLDDRPLGIGQVAGITPARPGWPRSLGTRGPRQFLGRHKSGILGPALAISADRHAARPPRSPTGSCARAAYQTLT
jgi:hypothetical protein